MRFPEGKAFAFTILDDTDDATTANVAPVYQLLRELGMRTTKTVWPMDCPEGSRHYFAAETLQNPTYRQFVEGLVRDGFELASHGATMESSKRTRTEAALDFYRRELGMSPTLHVNHGQNRENMYWGAERYRTWPVRAVATLLESLRRRPHCVGHVPGSPYFWGDLCRDQFRFVRNFTFRELDVSRIPPGRPYQVASTPFVQHWFTTADASSADHFTRLVTPAHVDALVNRGGFTIVSTHLGKGFVREGCVDPQVEETLRYVSALPGWFVPVSELLEFLLGDASSRAISWFTLCRLEGRHVLDRITDRYHW